MSIYLEQSGLNKNLPNGAFQAAHQGKEDEYYNQISKMAQLPTHFQRIVQAFQP